MSKFTRMAIAFATAATVSLAPLSVAQASSFGGSSNAVGGPIKSEDQRVADQLREALVSYAENSGNFENATTQKRADAWAERALDGDMPFVRDQTGTFYYYEGTEWDESGLYMGVVFRIPKMYGAALAESLREQSVDAGISVPFGATVVFDKNYYYATLVLKLS